MKKAILSTLFLLLFTGYGMAQEQAQWRFGLKMIPSVSWLKSELNEFENGSPKVNFGYGLMVERSVFKSTVLATGFFVNDLGGNYNYIGLDKTVNFKEQPDSILFLSRKLKLKYIEVPVALKFRTPEINYMTYMAHFGLDLGFRVKATSDDEFRDLTTGKTGLYEGELISDDVNFMRLGLDIGLGAEYSIAGSTSLLFGISYVNGFTNIMRKEAELLKYSDDSRVKQIFYGRAVTLHIGILF